MVYFMMEIDHGVTSMLAGMALQTAQSSVKSSSA
jgi:hypothetical protein